MMLSGWGLCIQKLHLQDLGIFQCFASNEGREIQTCTYLHTTSEYRPSAKPDHLGWALSQRENGSICSATDRVQGPAVTLCGEPLLRLTGPHVLSPWAAIHLAVLMLWGLTCSQARLEPSSLLRRGGGGGGSPFFSTQLEGLFSEQLIPKLFFRSFLHFLYSFSILVLLNNYRSFVSFFYYPIRRKSLALFL